MLKIVKRGSITLYFNIKTFIYHFDVLTAIFYICLPFNNRSDIVIVMLSCIVNIVKVTRRKGLYFNLQKRYRLPRYFYISVYSMDHFTQMNIV